MFLFRGGKCRAQWFTTVIPAGLLWVWCNQESHKSEVSVSSTLCRWAIWGSNGLQGKKTATKEKRKKGGRGREREGEKEAEIISFLSIILEVFRQFLALVIRPISSLTWQLQTLISPISWSHLQPWWLWVSKSCDLHSFVRDLVLWTKRLKQETTFLFHQWHLTSSS